VETEDFFKILKADREEGKLNVNLYQLKVGVFYYKGRILINSTSPLTEWISFEHHDTHNGGHSGYERTLQRLQKKLCTGKASRLV